MPQEYPTQPDQVARAEPAGASAASPLAALAVRVWEDRDGVSGRVAGRILRDTAEYAEVVSSAELRASVVTFMEPILRGIVEDRGPREDEIRRGDALGRRRADQTLPVEVLIRGIRLAYETLWLELDDAIRPDEILIRSALSRAAPTYWRWVDALTDAVAAAHAHRLRSREGSLAAFGSGSSS